MKKTVLATIFLFYSASTLSSEDRFLICPISKQYVCSIDGCKETKPSVTVKLKLSGDEAIYKRCDSKGCEV